MKRNVIFIAIALLTLLPIAEAKAQIAGQISTDKGSITLSEKDGYDVIRIAGSNALTRDVGAPELPAVQKSFVMPLDASVVGIDITTSQRTELRGKLTPYPVQKPVTVGGLDGGFTEPLDSIYNGNACYPAKRAEIVADYITMGYHIVTVMFYPLEYDPTTKKVIINDLAYNIKYSVGPTKRERPLAQSDYRATLAKKMVMSMVDNPEDVEKFYNAGSKLKARVKRSTANEPVHIPTLMDDMEEEVPDYIIITCDSLRPAFLRLANWKIEKGVTTIIKNIDDIRNEYTGSDLPEKIHAYLQECYHKWGEGLFVLLGGDTEIIPSRLYNYYNKQAFPSDAYYTDLNANWNSNNDHVYAETKRDDIKLDRFCFIGRAPVTTLSESFSFVDKILSYEKMSSSNVKKEYVMNHLVASAYISKSEDGMLYDGKQSDIDKELSKYTDINKMCLFDHYNCNCGKHTPATTEYSNRGAELTKSNLLAELNGTGKSGLGFFHIVYHMDHSSQRYLGASSKDKSESISIDDVDKLSNGDYQQIVISGGCSTTEFHKDCIAEHFVKAKNGGAVAFIGNANVGYAGEEEQYGEFINSLYNGNVTQLGILTEKMCRIGKWSTFYLYDTPSFLRLHLLGDPEMPVWSAVPQELDVTATRQYTPDKKYKISLQIKNLPAGEEALVCISKANDYYERIFISDNQTHEFILDANKTSGTMKITITARNFIPCQKSFSFDRPSYNGYYKIASLNGFNKQVAIGDSAKFDISILNSTGSLSYVKATLTSLSPYVIVDNGEVVYGDILAKTSKVGNQQFKISVSKDAPERMRNEWNAACLMLTIWGMPNAYQNYTCVDTFKIDIFSPKLRIAAIKVLSTSDGDKKLKAGETVTVALEYARMGKASSQPVKWTVTPVYGISEIISTTDSTCTFTVSDLYTQGAQLRAIVTLSDGSIGQDSLSVDFAHPGPDVDITKIHNASTEKTISFNWYSMKGETKYNIYRSPSANGSYVKLNKTPLTTRYFEDDGISPQVTYYYKLSTLSASNVEGNLSAPFAGITTYPLMMQQVLSSGDAGFVNEAYAADHDYDGQKEIVQVASLADGDENISTLYVAAPDGTEPFDIDDNVTTFSGYATYPWLIQAAPTVADLYGNGEQCVITLPRSADADGKTYAVCHSSQDKDGDNRPDKLWQTEMPGVYYRGPVVTDIDIPDGKGEKEILALDENGLGITVLNADGTARPTIGAGKVAGNYSSLAVADLDGDGYKEIISGGYGGVYIWKHDGTPFLREPFFSRPGSDLRSSPVVCDLDGDGQKEILVAERNATDPDRIFAIKPDGSCLAGFDGNDGSASIPYRMGQKGEGLDHAVTVGDLNGDDQLEVASLGYGCVRAWNNKGSQLFNRDIPELFNIEEWDTHMQMPIIADIDGDGNMDIVFNDEFTIYAIHSDGSDVLTFPMPGTAEMGQGVCVSDIDSDGKNELIVSDLGGYINVWKTNGHGIEWGSSRFDTERTGEYVKGASEPMALTSSRSLAGETINSDIIVRSGTLTISGAGLTMADGRKLIVMDGGELAVNGCSMTNANILIKAGGKLTINNGGKIELGKFGSFMAENGASVNIPNGEIIPQE